MTYIRSFAGLFCVLLLSVGGYALAETRKVSFKADVIPLTVPATKAFSLDMRTLLADVGTGALNWSASSDKPAWLTIDSPNSLMKGTPSLADVGQKNFRLFVQDVEAGAIAQIQMRVVIVPIWAQDPLDLGIQNEDLPFQLDLKTKVTLPGGGAITFSSGGGLPPWMTLTPAGILSGTPRRKDVGEYKDVILVATSPSGGSSTVKAFGKVLKTIHPPKWVANPQVLSDAFEDKSYSKDLVPFILNFEQTPLTFRIVSGPVSGWAKIATSGLLSGTPGKVDIGPVVIRAEVASIIDGQTFTDVAELRFNVIHTNHPPEWKQNPLVLPGGASGLLYTQNLSGSATDVDGDKLTFSLIDGPAWIKVAADGTFSGTPAKSDSGLNTFTVAVSDGEFAPRTTVQVTIIKTNDAPVVAPIPPVVMKEREDRAVDLKAFVTDADGDALTFSLVSPKDFVSLAGSTVTLKPKFKDIGAHDIAFRVSDGPHTVDGSFKLTVQRNPRPPVWLEDPITFTAGFGKPFSVSIAAKAQDLDGLPLTFSKVSGPTWLSVSAAGALSGTPAKADLGANSFKVNVRNDLLGVDATVVISVFDPNQAPIWLQDPVVLPDAPERLAYSQNLVPFVKDPDAGDILTFTKVNGPAWASLSPGGALTGTPGRADVGLNTFRIRVTDAGGLFAEANVRVNVLLVNQAPRWKVSPLSLSDAFEDFAYTFDISTFAEDPDGDPITFRKVSGATWLTTNAAGKLGGTPGKLDVGNFSAIFEVSDGKLSAQVTGNGKVIHTNHAPVAGTIPPQSVKERETATLDLKTFFSDSDGDALTLTLLDAKDWISLSSGVLTFSPKFKDIGNHEVRVRASDGALFAEGKVSISVLRNPRPPVWLENPIRFDAAIGKDFAASIKDKARDLDGLAISFSKTSGPAWLSVAADGTLSGRPAPPDLGDNTFVVTVKNDLLGAATSVIIRVFDPNQAPFWTQDPIQLSDAFDDRPFAFDLKPFAVDKDGDALTFRKIDGPAWLSLSPTGLLSGSPAKIDVGQYVAHFEVSDGKLAATVTARGQVLHVNHGPVIGVIPPVSMKERETRTLDLAPFASDVDGDALTFTLSSTLGWVSLTGTTLTFTPKFKDIGTHSIAFSVSDGEHTATGAVSVAVLRDAQPPVWLEDPIRFDAPVGKPFAASITDKAKELDGVALTFTKKSGPSWLSVSADGMLSGTPPQVADDSFLVTAKNDVLGTDVTVLVRVFDPNQAPIWTQDPLALPDAFEDKAFTFDVKPFAVDKDGDALTFKKIDGPTWLFLGAGGDLSGVPAKADVGDYVAHFEVSDGKLTATVTARGRVIHVNHPPVVGTVPPVTMKERQTLTVDLAPLVSDSDGDALTFALTSSHDWVKISGASLTLSPKFKDIGTHSIAFTVSDGEHTATGTLSVTVVRDPQAPVWLQDPIAFDAPVGKPFAASLKDLAKDLDGVSLSFSKKSGPAWLSVAADGSLSGTPPQVGNDTFQITARNEALGTDVTVNIRVFDPNEAPIWTQDPLALPDAFEDKTFAFDVKPFAIDKDGDALTFKKIDGPAWLFLGADGKLSGVPATADIGDYVAHFEVSDGKLAAVVTARGRVLDVNHPPVVGTIPAVTMKERETQTFDVAPFVTDGDADVLTFALSSGQDFVKMTGSVLTFTPKFKDIGAHSVIFRVTDGEHSVLGTVALTVVRDPRPPLWLEDPIRFNATAKTPFAASIVAKAIDQDGLAMVFTKVSGPAWLTISEGGLVTGTPQQSDAGENTFKVSVRNDLLGAEATMIVTVEKVNEPPVVDPTQLAFVIKERETQAHDLRKAVTDPDGDALTFALKTASDWATLAADGSLILRPGFKDIGDHTFVFEVTDGQFPVPANFTVKVIRDPRPPIWLEDPIRFQASIGKAFSANVKDKAKDQDGLPITFSKVSGPGWLSVAADGTLSGTPAAADLGENTFSLTVRNDLLGTNATVLIQVTDPNQAPFWTQDPLPLADAFEDKAYAFEISPFAVDKDGDALTFKKIDGPAWLVAASDGKLSGTPAKADLGDYVAHFEVSDGKLTANVAARGRVLHTNHAPVVGPVAPITMKERATLAVDLSLSATDPDGDVLTFALTSSFDWVSLTGAGLTLTPKFKDIGTHTINFTVNDGEFSVPGTLAVTVVRDPRPPVWLQDPIRFTAKIDQAFSASVAHKATDFDGLPLSFSKVSGPSWLSVAANGQLTGTPKVADLGGNAFVLEVKNDLLGANTQLLIEVVDPNHPPVWLQDPITLPNAPEKLFYSQALAPFAKDEDAGDTLTFNKVDGPAWATVTSTGAFSGVPARTDVGVNTFKVRVTDAGGKFAEATVLVTVELKNQAPQWTQDPIPLGDIPTEKLFTFDIATFAIDADGDALTFKLSDGPAWLQVVDGKLTGTPQLTDLGEFTATVTVSDGVAEAKAGVFGRVFNPINHPPVIAVDKLFFIVKERNVLSVDLNHADFVVDPDGDLMTFALEPVPQWVTFTQAGKLEAKPMHPQLGDHTFKLTVTDARGLSSTAPLFIRVMPDPLPPKWLENPIRFTARVGVPFTAAIGSKAVDPDGLPLTISKASGAVWLTVAGNGDLSGTPALQDFGENQFQVQASNGTLSAFTTVIITVTAGQDQTDTVQVDTAVPGAPTENLWVIDNSANLGCDDELAQSLRKYIGVYRSALNSAQVRDLGVFVGTNAKKFDGLPIKSKAGSWLLRFDDASWSTDYRYRVDQVFGREGYNSPIWSMFRFYERLPNISDLYHRGFSEAQIPGEVMLVTQQKDIYAKYAQGTAQQSWTMADYSKSFRDFHVREKKSYRVSAIGPSTEAAYKTIVQDTAGTLYPYVCPFPMENTLRDYAKKVIFRAYVQAKRSISLSKVPLDPKAIQFSLGGVVIPGNTGALEDKWFYDKAENAVKIQWFLFDMNTVKPGDKVEIRYRF